MGGYNNYKERDTHKKNKTVMLHDFIIKDFDKFVGIRRPQNVFIGNTARYRPDIDQSVLMRNEDFRFRDYTVNVIDNKNTGITWNEAVDIYKLDESIFIPIKI